jgi:hypothetical protein
VGTGNLHKRRPSGRIDRKQGELITPTSSEGNALGKPGRETS